jgi:hypothetical protein
MPKKNENVEILRSMYNQPPAAFGEVLSGDPGGAPTKLAKIVMLSPEIPGWLKTFLMSVDEKELPKILKSWANKGEGWWRQARNMNDVLTKLPTENIPEVSGMQSMREAALFKSVPEDLKAMFPKPYAISTDKGISFMENVPMNKWASPELAEKLAPKVDRLADELGIMDIDATSDVRDYLRGASNLGRTPRDIPLHNWGVRTDVPGAPVLFDAGNLSRKAVSTAAHELVRLLGGADEAKKALSPELYKYLLY